MSSAIFFSVRVFLILVVCATILSVLNNPVQHRDVPIGYPREKTGQEETDSLIWKMAVQFTTLYNGGDTAAMNRFLPDDFMLQLMHENFLGKISLMNTMKDSAVQSTFKHVLRNNVQTIIRYGDNHQSAGLEAPIDFVDQTMTESVKKEHGYGLCIMYFQKRNDRWWLVTVHLDLHCSLCNE